MKLKQSLQLKLLYSFMLIITVLVIGVSFGVSLLVKEQMLVNKQQELIAKGSELTHTVDEYYQKNGSLAGLETLLNTVDSFLESRVWVVTEAHQVVAMSTPRWGMRAGMHGLSPRGGNMKGTGLLMQAGGMRSIVNELSPVFEGNTLTRTFDNPYYGEKMLLVALPIELSNGSIRGAVVLHAPVTGIDSFMGRIYYYIGAAALTAIFLSLLAVTWFTRTIVRPLENMQQTAVAMARGDYSKQIKVATSDEVGHLGVALNALATDLAKYTAELEQMETLRREFVANVSHELRAPLSVIRGYHEALMDGTVTDPKLTTKYHQFMQSEIVRLEQLIKDLLDLSRLQSGKDHAEKEKIPLSSLVTSVLHMLKQQAEQKQIALDSDIDASLPAITGNGARLTQLMLILLDNAIKYTPPNGTITVRTYLEDHFAVLQVEDTGIGISKDDLPYIWERFYKADKSRCRDDEGTGLGLAIAKQIVELHEARAEVTSVSSQGTSFKVKFPL